MCSSWVSWRSCPRGTSARPPARAPLTDKAKGQQGFGLNNSWTAGVIHPFASLLASNGGELVGILMPIRMREEAHTPIEIRGFMQASGKDVVKPKSVVERAKAVKAESGAAAARFQVVAINEQNLKPLA